jgi:PAS domain S-box-containing protein
MGNTDVDDRQHGDMDRPPDGQTFEGEAASIARALESTRADLQQTLAELRQEKAWTDHLLESIVEGIVTLDRQGHITFFSQGAERITGWQCDHVLGHPCDQVFRPVGTNEPFTQLLPGPGGSRRIAVELRDGRQAMLAVTGARLLPPEGNNARVALVFRDVSEEEAVHRILGDFLANIAHEFRTPLSAVAASVELLLDQVPDLMAASADPISERLFQPGPAGQAGRVGIDAQPTEANTELQELLASLHTGIMGLQTLVDNLLESASIETGHFRVHPRPSGLGEIIAEAIRMVQPLIDKHSQQLVIELPAPMPIVQADPRRVAQVLVNLLSNAAKHNPDDAEIGILVSVQGDRVRVAVADQGPGIPAEERNLLFRRFAHPNTGNDPAKAGAGLGLSVVKAIVEAHGGQVGVEDRPGSGVIFWFTLPRAPSSALRKTQGRPDTGAEARSVPKRRGGGQGTKSE